MKTKTILLTATTLLCLLIGGVGCEKEDNTIYPEAVIIKELPVMYGALVEHGTVQLIQSQRELNKLFNGSTPTFPEELTNIDFERNSLIIGATGDGRDVVKLEHHLRKKDSNKYHYSLNVMYSIAAIVIAPFSFGVIVNKLPSEINIELEVTETNN